MISNHLNVKYKWELILYFRNLVSKAPLLPNGPLSSLALSAARPGVKDQPPLEMVPAQTRWMKQSRSLLIIWASSSSRLNWWYLYFSHYLGQIVPYHQRISKEEKQKPNLTKKFGKFKHEFWWIARFRLEFIIFLLLLFFVSLFLYK